MRLVQRAQIILMAAAGTESQEIARSMKVSRPTVQLWRQRFLALRLVGLEKYAPRPGRIPIISPERISALVEATLHPKPPHATHWSTRSMAGAQGLSEATIRRIWKQHNLKPHPFKTFKLSRDKHFIEKLHDIVGLYLNPPDKSLVLCVDEKSQILASKASSVSFAFYSDFKLLVEYDRTMVPRDYRQTYPARDLSERARIDRCYQRLSGQSQPKSPGFCMERNCGTNFD